MPGEVLAAPSPAARGSRIVGQIAMVPVLCQLTSGAARSVPVNYPANDSAFNWVQVLNSPIQLCKYHVNRNKLR